MFEQLKEMIRNYVQVADEDIHACFHAIDRASNHPCAMANAEPDFWEIM